MNPLSKLINRIFSPRVKNEINQSAPHAGMQRIGGSLFGNIYSDGFAADYPSISAIANEYMQVRPYAVDKNGKQVQNNPVINALYHPNQVDSSIMFAQKVAISTLVHRKTYLLVWRNEDGEAQPGGPITPKNIAGFTFLEYPGVSRRDGHTYYTIGAQEFTEDEVIVLPGGVDPNNLYGGYSPSEASRKWGQLDDYIADYQAGFFENGAVPAGMFIVTAPSVKEYEDIVDMLQTKHRGAGNNNNITYSHRPITPSTGKPAQAQIEWIPFQQSNKDIDFKNLFDQVNKRIDLAYGVPQIVKGVDDAATYANAQVAERGFAKRAVYPKLLLNYTQITHELNRITNGLGVAISFKYELPAIADEQLVQAQAATANVTNIESLLALNFSLDSIVDALELPNNYKLLKEGTGEATIENDKPDVDEGDEVEGAPDPTKIDGVTPLNVTPKHPKNEKDPDGIYSPKGRYLGKKLANGFISLKSPDKTEVIVKVGE